MLGQFGFLERVFSIFEELGISVDVVATSEVSICLTLDPSKLWERELIKQELDRMVEELEKDSWCKYKNDFARSIQGEYFFDC